MPFEKPEANAVGEYEGKILPYSGPEDHSLGRE